jgi:hypothetical protein
MSKQILAISFILLCTSAAWMILAGTVVNRTNDAGKASRQSVGHLWGGPQVQQAPRAVAIRIVEEIVEHQEADDPIVRTVQREHLIDLPIELSNIDTRLKLEHRKKGLLWHPTYEVRFSGDYLIRNPEAMPIRVRLEYDVPAGGSVLDDFHFSLLDDPSETSVRDGRVVREIEIEAHGEARFSVGYLSRGVDTWHYEFGSRVQEVRDFRLTLHTDFAAIDFPAGTLSPSAMVRADAGWTLTWDYRRLVTEAGIGMKMPERLNPGPWVSRVTFFAPVSLLLFFFLIFVIAIIREIPLHPMHYFFLAAAFFAFHLLLAYLVDHLSVHLAALIASVTSLALVISYMRLVVNNSFAFSEIGIAQLIYLVGFSYTFFFPGYTGLAITVLAITTLFVVMQATARVDWEEAFGDRPGDPSGHVPAA